MESAMEDIKQKLKAKLKKEHAEPEETARSSAPWSRVPTQRLEEQDIIASMDVPEGAPDYTAIPPPAPTEPPKRS
ncbi:MAG: hypothetical protein AAGI01_18635 [Myxococcota bacterium]